jgi:hypothetical protein
MTTAVAQELKDFQGVLDDEGANAVQDENDVAAESIDFSELRMFVESVGPDVIGNSADWYTVLDIPIGQTTNAEQKKELAVTTRRVRSNHVTGFTAANILAWCEKHKVGYRLTAVAQAMLDATPAEAINPDQLYSCESVSRKFGVPITQIQDAVLGGEIRTTADANVWASTSRIEGEPLLRWVTDKNIPLRISIEVARLIVLRRQVPPQVEVPDAPPSVITEAADILDRERETELAVERENTSNIQKAYREILSRRHEPQVSDAKLLAEVCRELELTPEDVHRDAAILERAADLAVNARDIDNASVELNAAAEGLRDTKKRHEAELKAAQSRVSAARDRHHHATSAGPELQSIRKRRPELFG